LLDKTILLLLLLFSLCLFLYQRCSFWIVIWRWHGREKAKVLQC